MQGKRPQARAREMVFPKGILKANWHDAIITLNGSCQMHDKTKRNMSRLAVVLRVGPSLTR
jgi:hypothetical protein